MVVWCRRHPDPREANQPVGALLRLAADPVAARTLLQVLLPGLNIRIGRAAAKEARCRRRSGALDELAQEVVGAAWERIAALAGTSPAWPACELVEGAWRRVRHEREKGRLCQRRLWPLEGATPQAEPEWTRTTAEELTMCLVDAVRAGRLRPSQAGVVYTTRVLGVRLGRSLGAAVRMSGPSGPAEPAPSAP